MSTVSHYFCIFCDFTCKEYDNAFDHYNSHMFVSGNCELCDYSKLVVYKTDPKDLSIKCQSCQNGATNERQLMTTVIHYWINKFLSYQNKILKTTYEKLLVTNKVCVECSVCRYLLEKYESNGGDMSRIQYIRDKKVEHCYQHLRYDLKARRINEYIANTANVSRPKRILKVEALIEYCCDTFFTVREQIDDNNDSVVNIASIDNNSTIQESDSECLSCLENTETIAQLSPSFEDTLQQSLAQILSKLSIVERELDKTKTDFQATKNNLSEQLLAIKDEHILKTTQFYIENNDTGLVLDIKDSSREPYAAIQMYSYHGGRNQLWEYRNGMIHSALNNYALDVSEADGRSVITYPANGNPGQKWHFDADNTIRCEFRNLVLDVKHSSRDKCAKVTAHQKHNDHNQLFRIVYV